MKKDRQVGFTLIELLIVVSIIAILAVIGFISYSSAQSSARATRRSADLKKIAAALELYNNAKGHYPAKDPVGCIETLEAELVPTYINSLPKDPNGINCYQYISDGGINYKIRTNIALQSSDFSSTQKEQNTSLIDSSQDGGADDSKVDPVAGSVVAWAIYSQDAASYKDGVTVPVGSGHSIPSPPATCPTNGLVSYWKFDSSTQGNADPVYGGSSLNLTPSATTPTFSSAGKIGQSMKINTGNYVSYLTCPHANCGGASKLDPPNGISIASWLFVDVPTDTRYIASKFQSVPSQMGYSLNLSPTGKLYFVLCLSGNCSYLLSNQSIPASTWRFIAVTFDGSMMRIYINGVLDSYLATGSGSFSSNGNFLTGISSGTSNGFIDELGIWNKAISQNEIDNLYNYGSAVACP